MTALSFTRNKRRRAFDDEMDDPCPKRIKLDTTIFFFKKHRLPCICDGILTAMNVDDCYGKKSIICDQCDQTFKNDTIVYHCENDKNSVHPHGYDLCSNCVHSKQYKHFKRLKTESCNRKSEWNRSSAVIPSFIDVECPYYAKCREVMSHWLPHLGMLNSEGDQCFCQKCHKKRGDKEAYYRGDPNQLYVLPIGYARFGIKIPKIYVQHNILSKWHVVYHGTTTSSLKGICESGLILLKPNDWKLSKDVAHRNRNNEIRNGHIERSFVRTNKCTGNPELFDPIQIFTSPSCIYSSYYSDKINICGFNTSFMFQCRQKPETYCRGQETMAFGKMKIDKWIDNDSIEFYTKQNLNIVITGLLVKIDSFP